MAPGDLLRALGGERSVAACVSNDPFTTDAEHKAMPMGFFIKLSLIFLALAVYVRLGKLVFTSAAPSVVRRSDRS
jgi:hypothetical protein